MKIKYTHEQEYLDIELKDSFNYELLIDVINNIGRFKSNKVLIDGSDLNNAEMNYVERYHIGSYGSSKFKSDVKYVVVWPKQNLNYLAISLLRLNGINIRAYSNVSLALSWLLVNKKLLDLDSLE